MCRSLRTRRSSSENRLLSDSMVRHDFPLVIALPPPSQQLVSMVMGPERPTMESLGAMCRRRWAPVWRSDCAREFKGSFQAGAPPPSEQPSDLLMGIIRCYNANIEGHPKLPADSCPNEMAVCEAEEGCIDELHAALNAVAPPTEVPTS